MPPGRTVMLVNSGSGVGLSMRDTDVRGVFPVREDMSVRADVVDPSTAEWSLRACCPTVLPRVLAPPWANGGVMYSSGSGTQWLEKWNVPRFNSVTNVRNCGRSTPACPAATLVPKLCQYSYIVTCTVRMMHAK